MLIPEGTKAVKVFTAAETWLTNNGDRVWEWLCDTMPCNKPWRAIDAAADYAEEHRVAVGTAYKYITCVCKCVEDQGNKAIVSLRRGWWFFPEYEETEFSRH